MKRPSSQEEQAYLEDQLLSYANHAQEELFPLYIGDAAPILERSFRPYVSFDDQRGAPIPNIGYDGNDRSLRMRIEPDTILDFAEEFIARDDADVESLDYETGDVAKMLVGAGVARAIVAWKTLPLPFVQGVDREYYVERLDNRESLWMAADAMDDAMPGNPVHLRSIVGRMNDEIIARINTVRFAVGASLNYLFDATDLQTNIPNTFKYDLIQAEVKRERDFELARAILESADDAFMLYDDAVPDLLYGLTFPMTPAEELGSFAAQPPDKVK